MRITCTEKEKRRLEELFRNINLCFNEDGYEETCKKYKSCDECLFSRIEWDIRDSAEPVIDRIGLAVSEFESGFQTKVVEDTEQFLFKTVQPFCETVVEHRIKKKDLVEALTKHSEKARIFNAGRFECPVCHNHVYSEQKYCDECGQHMTAFLSFD